MERILLIEDEEGLALPIQRGLEEEGYQVDLAGNGEDGLLQALTSPYAVIILDWRLPGIDGLAVVERLRGAKMTVPVLMLTAMRDVDYRVRGLNAGADDYLTKPFSFEELLARIKALGRRTQAPETPPGHERVLFKAGPLEMDTIRRTARLGPHPLSLRMKEYQLLELLIRRVGDVVTRTAIAERVWGSPFDVTDNAIDVTVSNLRQHLESAAHQAGTVRIETIRGVGYRLDTRSGSALADLTHGRP